MNFLAHALLAGDDENLIVGAFLGDFHYGAPEGRFAEGIRLHRAIDRYTDAHPIFRQSKQLFEPPFRRYAGILVDIYYDHALARDWKAFSDVPLPAFSQQVYEVLQDNAVELPDKLNQFVSHLVQHDLLTGYAEPARIDRVLVGVSSRLKRANPLAEASSQREKHDSQLKRDFAAFFPDLTNHAGEIRRTGAEISS